MCKQHKVLKNTYSAFHFQNQNYVKVDTFRDTNLGYKTVKSSMGISQAKFWVINTFEGRKIVIVSKGLHRDFKDVSNVVFLKPGFEYARISLLNFTELFQEYIKDSLGLESFYKHKIIARNHN